MNKLMMYWMPTHFVIRDEDASLTFTKLDDREGYLGGFVFNGIDRNLTDPETILNSIEQNAKELSLVAKLRGIEGLEINNMRESDIPLLEIFIPDIYPLPPYYEDNNLYVLCPDEASLAAFAKDGGWDDLEDLELDLEIDREELIGIWFFTSHGRVYLKEE